MIAGLRREWPLAVSLAVVFVGLFVVGNGHFRRGTIVLSFGVALALFLRVLLPAERAGMLAVRSKGVDIGVLASLAILTSAMSLWVPPPS